MMPRNITVMWMEGKPSYIYDSIPGTPAPPRRQSRSVHPNLEREPLPLPRPSLSARALLLLKPRQGRCYFIGGRRCCPFTAASGEPSLLQQSFTLQSRRESCRIPDTRNFLIALKLFRIHKRTPKMSKKSTKNMPRT